VDWWVNAVDTLRKWSSLVKGAAPLGLILIAASLVACQLGGIVPSTGSPNTIAPALVDIQDIDQLQSRFNANAGSPRLVLLISPT
jgi:hypothetical protein